MNDFPALRAGLLGCLLLGGAAFADDFSARCSELPQQAKIAVTFRDRPVDSDDTRTIQELNRIAGRPAGDYHNVYGLTHAKPDFKMQVAPRILVADDGRVPATGACRWWGVRGGGLRSAFSPLTTQNHTQHTKHKQRQTPTPESAPPASGEYANSDTLCAAHVSARSVSNVERCIKW